MKHLYLLRPYKVKYIRVSPEGRYKVMLFVRVPPEDTVGVIGLMELLSRLRNAHRPFSGETRTNSITANVPIVTQMGTTEI